MKYLQKGKRRAGRFLVGALALLLCLGLALGSGSEVQAQATTAPDTESSDETTAPGADKTTTPGAAAKPELPDGFTERDFYTAVGDSEPVTLKDGAAASRSKAVSVTGDVITITSGGDYLLSGSLTNGQIVIDARDTDRVRLVLDGVAISNASSAAIYVKNANKVTL
ncbi:MAG: carbohydrate-binding domain-containing protein, partial [Firmicutes bacterium]|nr:carbohydrate-binding domain-containing protein [Bacillota bacterium]